MQIYGSEYLYIYIYIYRKLKTPHAIFQIPRPNDKNNI